MAHDNSNWNIAHNGELSQDAQGRWDELLSPTQVLTVQRRYVQHDDERQAKKRKCRGNRKEQHKKRRERRLGQKQNKNNDTNPMNENVLIVVEDNSYHSDKETVGTNNHIIQNDYASRTTNKRKRQEDNTSNACINRSFSELSISQRHSKRAASRTTTTNNRLQNEILNELDYDQSGQQQNMEGNDNDQILPTNNGTCRFKPHFLRVSHKIFKQILSDSIEHGEKLVQCLDTNDKIHFVRRITELVNNLCYFDLQRHLWQEYFNIGVKNNGTWAPRFTKSFAKQHHTCRTYGYPKHTIDRRQKNIAKQLEYNRNELQKVLVELEEKVKEWRPSIDSIILSTAINDCVQKNQQRLREEFQYKKKMLELDSNDHCLINEFYRLQPNEEQIQLATGIWQATANELKTVELKETLRKRIFLRRLPSETDKIINRSVAALQLLLSDPVIDKDRRASLISSCSKTLTQYKFDLMSINLATIESIKHGHQLVLTELQDKLIEANFDLTIKQAIENRQQTMRQRHEIYLKHLLNTFFDEAPTTVINE